MKTSFPGYGFQYKLSYNGGRWFAFQLIATVLFLTGISKTLYGQADFITTQLKASPLTEQGGFSERMVSQMDTFLMKKLQENRRLREQEWITGSKAPQEEWQRFLEEKRDKLRKVWGISGNRRTASPEILTGHALKPVFSENDKISIHPVKLNVLDGLDMTGIIVQPKGIIKARLVFVPDADQLPEQWAGLSSADGQPDYRQILQLAEQGIQVMIPALVSRGHEFSGSESLQIYTNQPHREWIYRQGFVTGRHIIGYEMQKISACIDWMERQNNAGGGHPNVPIGIAGYGEGGLLALCTVSTDTRLSVALISGYLGSSENVWQEPIYRNLFGNLKHAGNAELLAMGSHARMIIEYAKSPVVNDPVEVEGRRGGAAPGRLITPSPEEVQKEISIANSYLKTTGHPVTLISNEEGIALDRPLSFSALKSLVKALGSDLVNRVPASVRRPAEWINNREREQRIVEQMGHLMQNELDICEQERNRTFWEQIRHDPVKDKAAKAQLRKQMYEVIGKITDPFLLPAPKIRLLESNNRWTKYEVKLDVWEGIFAWGILVVPKIAENGKSLPVVVCQHGLEGLPEDLITRDTTDRKFKVYKSMALDLAERGYVTFSPHNPYRGEHHFRVLQRKANPLGLSLFSLITGQHQQIVNWLGNLSFVDSSKIGFYGLSYGGKSAMRIPALVEGYALSVCSGDFNEWVRKVGTTRERFSYQFTKEYEIYEWNLGHTFNYAEMASLIAPRPFMVEYGYLDGIGTAEWIGYEFGKVRKHYDLSGLSERLDIDRFNGVHEINGKKTYPFLDKHLK